MKKNGKRGGVWIIYPLASYFVIFNYEADKAVSSVAMQKAGLN